MYDKLNIKKNEILLESDIAYIENGIVGVCDNIEKGNAAIVDKLESKGVELSGNSIGDILQGIDSLGSVVVERPLPEGDWIDIREGQEDGTIRLLVSDQAGGLTLGINARVSYNTNYFVDWGDGFKDEVTSGKEIKHTYRAGSGTPGPGQTYFVVTISAVDDIYRIHYTWDSPILWMCSKNVNLTEMDAMFCGGNGYYTTNYDSSAYYSGKFVKRLETLGGVWKPTTARAAFRGMLELTEFLVNLDLSECVGTYDLFSNCRKLVDFPEALDLNRTDSMSKMFFNCYMMKKSPILIGGRLSTTHDQLFYNCKVLTEVQSEFNLEKSQNISHMFRNCELLEKLPRLINTQNITTTDRAFSGCSSITQFSQDSFDLPSVENIERMFEGTSKLNKSPKLTGLQKLKYANYVYTSSGIVDIDIDWVVPSLLKFEWVFYNAPRLNKINVKLNAPILDSVYCMCFTIPSLTYLNAELDTPIISNIGHLASSCGRLSRVDGFINRNGSTTLTAVNMFNSNGSLQSCFSEINLKNCINAQGLFAGCTSLRQVPDVLDVSNCATVVAMFDNCKSLSKVPEILDISKCTEASNLFSGCSMLENVPEVLDMSNVTKVHNLFNGCSLLRKVPDRLNLKKENVISMYSMFAGCSVLENIPEDLFVVGDNIGSLFNGCRLITSVPEDVDLLPGASIAYAFYSCASIKQISPNYTNKGARSFDNTFNGCTSLITLPPLDLANSTNNNSLVSNCGNIEGEIVIKNATLAFDIGSKKKVTSIRLINISPNITGSSPQIRIHDCGLNEEALNQFMEDLPVVDPTSGKGIRILGNPGTEFCDTKIATSKGWAVIN